MIKVGIVGGAGYTAGELIRILIHHPQVEIDFVYSTSNADNTIGSVHQDLIGETFQKFTSEINLEVDVVFICLGHGNSKAFITDHSFSSDTVIIDLSNDFRLEQDKDYNNRSFVYGLPELNRESIATSQNIANPGCFATAIQLALLPMANNGLLHNDVHVNAVTGATGAGTGLSNTSHFPWRNNNFSSYKEFNHQHLGEIYRSVRQLQKGFENEILFIPNRGNFSRGIYATLYTVYEGHLDDAKTLYHAFFKNAPFVTISNESIHLKQVINTNNCFINIQQHNNKLLVTSCIDNLIKGASGQAIQNMNLIFGFEEQTGLKLKGSYF